MNPIPEIDLPPKAGESTALAKPISSEVTTLNPMELLNRAVNAGAGMDVVERLMALQERWEANLARKAFDAAIAAAKSEIPVILKNRKVGYEHKDGKDRTEYRHEDLGQIARAVDPILGKHGLSYRFRTTSNINEPITVTCIVSHRDGHSEQNTLSAGRDDSGKKNAIQSIGSTITYLQRYSLKASLGLAASNDDDGNGGGDDTGELLTPEQVSALSKLIVDTGGDVQKFCRYAKVDRLEDIFASKYEAAVNAVKQAAEARKAKP